MKSTRLILRYNHPDNSYKTWHYCEPTLSLTNSMNDFPSWPCRREPARRPEWRAERDSPQRWCSQDLNFGCVTKRPPCQPVKTQPCPGRRVVRWGGQMETTSSLGRDMTFGLNKSQLLECWGIINSFCPDAKEERPSEGPERREGA